MRLPRPTAFLLAIVATISLLAAPIGPTAPGTVRAATPDLTIVSVARYDVQPAKQRVHITADLTVTNRLKDTTTRLYYFDYAVFDVLPGTSGFKVTTDGTGSPRVRAIRTTKDYTRLRIDFGTRLKSGKSAVYRLTFDLKDPGGRATRELRVGDALVSFPVWAFASDATPGSTVTVVFPAGYDVTVEAGEIPAPTTTDDGRTILRTGALPKPLDFFAYLVADRPGAYQESTLTTDVLDQPVEVIVRAWSDDAPWAKRVGGLLDRALPVLGARIGLPWPEYDGPLTVQESVSRSTGGYAGVFDPSSGEVEIAYYADDFVVLHEAAHAWFNGSLLADRWSNEAFASYYAAAAALDLKHKVEADVLTDALQAARIPLNGWGPVGTEDVAREDYAYAASLELARQIAKRADAAGLRAVWADASDGLGAYQPVGGGEETVDGPPDWRGLLDLLEARTDATYDDLWRTWVARPADLALLDARTAARERYAGILAAVRDWRLPKPVRDALRAWRFDDATRLIDEGEDVLALRQRVERAADAADLIAPSALRLAFEDDDGFEDATIEATAELRTMDRYVAATTLRPPQITPLLTLGLWSETPETDLIGARDAFARGDLEGSVAASDEAAASWANAESVGGGRAFSIGALILASLLFVGMLVATIRRRRRRRRRLRMATPRLDP